MLRTRLTLGLLCLLLILLAIGLYSINECSWLGHRIQAASRDSDQAGLNIGQLKRSGAAMTGALLTLVTGDEAASRKEYAAASQSFAEALGEENSRQLATSDEKNLIAKLNGAFQSYNARARALIEANPQPDPAWRTTAAKLGQDTSTLLNLVDELTVAHEQAVTQGYANISRDINSTVRSLTLLMIVAIAFTIFASLRLGRGLLDPLKTLTSSIQQVGEGNLDQTVPVLDNHELGMLARSFNQMAAQLRLYKTNTSEELMRLNQTIRSTLANFPDPVFVLNSEGAVEFRNPAADQLAVKLLFSGVTRLPEKVDKKVEQVQASGEDYLPTSYKDAVKFRIDAQDRYFLTRVVLLRDDRRSVFGVAVILEDVTRMLLVDDIKNNLISTVSHELKTPLTSIRMALYLLHERTLGPLGEKQGDLVATAREDVDRLLRTLNDLLDLARLEQGKTPLQYAPAKAEALIDSAIHATREVTAAASMNVRKEIAPDLPGLRVDARRLDYVFSNFITNAVKYAPAGGEIVVRASPGKTRHDRPAVRFAVIDHGPGIEHEHREHIFDRFYRVPGTQKSGAGLGLSIAREIVTAHQGDIGVISEPGQGSEFFFIIPCSQEQPAALGNTQGE
jgi:signal transduction histidine kinase